MGRKLFNKSSAKTIFIEGVKVTTEIGLKYQSLQKTSVESSN